MRVREGVHGAEFVDWVWNILYSESQRYEVEIPRYIHQLTDVSSPIDRIYPQELMMRAGTDPTVFCGRCLLSSLNTTVTELHGMILGRLPGQIRVYQSTDTHVTDADVAETGLDEFPAEVLRNIDFPSLPPSQLSLKIGAPIMVLRNLAPAEGLCNETRMVMTNLRRHCIEARILGGDRDGQKCVLPRTELISDDHSLGIKLKRKQFPVRLCFAMTINKSQGQSFHTAGLDLRTPVFTHGQLYVVVSRTFHVEGLSVLLPTENRGLTQNVVYEQVLTDIR